VKINRILLLSFVVFSSGINCCVKPKLRPIIWIPISAPSCEPNTEILEINSGWEIAGEKFANQAGVLSFLEANTNSNSKVLYVQTEKNKFDRAALDAIFEACYEREIRLFLRPASGSIDSLSIVYEGAH
jgi:hypothetical protein